jgi:hypothetical protein
LAYISTVGQAAKAMPDEEMQAEIEDFLKGFNQPTYRRMRVNGQRFATPGCPSMGGLGTAGRMRSGSNNELEGHEWTVKRKRNRSR